MKIEIHERQRSRRFCQFRSGRNFESSNGQRNNHFTGSEFLSSSNAFTAFGNPMIAFDRYHHILDLAVELACLLKEGQGSVNQSGNFVPKLKSSQMFFSFTNSDYYIGNTNFNSWVLDSGASRHITFYKNLFLDLKKLGEFVRIGLPNGNDFIVAHGGHGYLNTDIT